jgi:raffinose/stachyose/melibiose transport system permease protein
MAIQDTNLTSKSQKKTLQKSNKSSKITSSTAMLNIMYLPALILFIVFIFYPFIKGVAISFTDWDGFSQGYNWVGLSKYKAMFSDPKILNTIKNTLIYGIGSTFFQNIIGLAFALLLDQKIRGKGFVRTLVYLPAIISGLIMGYIWYFFFQYNGGAINDIMIFLGKEPVNWLENGRRAVWIITGVNTFQYLGVAMIIFLAGLQNIPRVYYEAASIDGASSMAKFKNITLPLLMPAITVSVVQNLIGGLKLFDVIMAMTGGGPGYATQSLSTMMHSLYFSGQDAGYAAALGNTMFLIICVISISALKFFRSKEVEM